MTKRVKLPAELGGAEVEAIDADPLPMMIAGVPVSACQVPGVGWVAVPKSKLTDVPPPSPLEPPEFSTVRVGVRAYVRDDPPHGHLSWYGPEGRKSWEELCAKAMQSTGFPPVLLVPAPEPVTLPWTQAGFGVTIRAEPGWVYEDQSPGIGRVYRPEGARAKAYALLAAADQAEAVDRG